MTTTTEKKETMYKNIVEHGKDLKRVFNLDDSIDEIKLCKSLFRIENKAHELATHFCNYGYESEEETEKINGNKPDMKQWTITKVIQFHIHLIILVHQH